MPQPFIIEDSTDEEHCRRAQGAGFVDLVFVDDEILAQDRCRDGCGNFLQVLRAAEEIILFRQDGNGRSAGLFIFFGNGYIGKVGSDEALRRRSLLDFADKGQPRFSQILFKREAFLFRRRQGPRLHDFQGHLLFIRNQPLGDGRRKII